MASVALDTLSASRRLREVGFSEPQAEAVARLVADRSDSVASNAITPEQLSHEFAVSRAEVRADTAKTNNEMAQLRAEMNAGFDLIREQIKAHEATIKLEIEKRVGGVERDTLVLKWMMGFMLAGLLALLMRAFADIILR